MRGISTKCSRSTSSSRRSRRPARDAGDGDDAVVPPARGSSERVGRRPAPRRCAHPARGERAGAHEEPAAELLGEPPPRSAGRRRGRGCRRAPADEAIDGAQRRRAVGEPAAALCRSSRMASETMRPDSSGPPVPQRDAAHGDLVGHGDGDLHGVTEALKLSAPFGEPSIKRRSTLSSTLASRRSRAPRAERETRPPMECAMSWTRPRRGPHAS